MERDNERAVSHDITQVKSEYACPHTILSGAIHGHHVASSSDVRHFYLFIYLFTHLFYFIFSFVSQDAL